MSKYNTQTQVQGLSVQFSCIEKPLAILMSLQLYPRIDQKIMLPALLYCHCWRKCIGNCGNYLKEIDNTL